MWVILSSGFWIKPSGASELCPNIPVEAIISDTIEHLWLQQFLLSKAMMTSRMKCILYSSIYRFFSKISGKLIWQLYSRQTSVNKQGMTHTDQSSPALTSTSQIYVTWTPSDRLASEDVGDKRVLKWKCDAHPTTPSVWVFLCWDCMFFCDMGDAAMLPSAKGVKSWTCDCLTENDCVQFDQTGRATAFVPLFSQTLIIYSNKLRCGCGSETASKNPASERITQSQLCQSLPSFHPSSHPFHLSFLPSIYHPFLPPSFPTFFLPPVLPSIHPTIFSLSILPPFLNFFLQSFLSSFHPSLLQYIHPPFLPSNYPPSLSSFNSSFLAFFL